MPKGNESLHQPLRHMLYGVAKSRKTWWSLTAAEHGFRVILLDGDKGGHIVKQLSPEAQARVNIVNCADTLSDSKFARFIARLLADETLIWDDTDNARVLMKPNSEHSFARLKVSELGLNDVLVLDSWTALSWSTKFQYSIEQNIDLADAEKTEWGGYGWSANFLDWVIGQLKSLPCHVIIVCHQDIWEKTREVKRGGRKEQEVVLVRTQPISSSRPHGHKIAKDFTEVLYFYYKEGGSDVWVSNKSEYGRDGGTRTIELDDKWENVRFLDLLKAAGEAEATEEISDGFRWLSFDELSDYMPQKKKLLIGTDKPALEFKTAETPVQGLTMLLNKAKGKKS